MRSQRGAICADVPLSNWWMTLQYPGNHFQRRSAALGAAVPVSPLKLCDRECWVDCGCNVGTKTAHCNDGAQAVRALANGSLAANVDPNPTVHRNPISRAGGLL